MRIMNSTWESLEPGTRAGIKENVNRKEYEGCMGEGGSMTERHVALWVQGDDLR